MSQQEAATARKVAPTLDLEEAAGLNSQSPEKSETQEGPEGFKPRNMTLRRLLSLVAKTQREDPYAERTPSPHMILQLTMS